VSSIFFFSSRRRHTRFSRDWSSDVCSSDLFKALVYEDLITNKLCRCRQHHTRKARDQHQHAAQQQPPTGIPNNAPGLSPRSCVRSEERRVGKECRSRREPSTETQNTTNEVE